jgi:UMF1 family MFS transporter
MILVAVLGLEACGLLLAWILSRPGTAGKLLERFASRLDTRSCILLGLFAYAMIATWGYFLDSVLEFWCLAWMVATVQGGTQALSRSLYASLSPAAKSGEFFGLFGIMEKFSAVAGPLIFAAVGAYAGSSRPAVLSIIVLFIVGGFILLRVNVAEGRRVAREEDAALLGRNRPSISDP